MGHRFSQIYTDNNYIIVYASYDRIVFVQNKYVYYLCTSV